MKSFITLLAMVSTSQMLFAAKLNFTLPNSLQCEAVQRVYGNPEAEIYAPYRTIKIQDINSKDNMKWNEDLGVISQMDDKVVLDFGVGANGGDQFSTFTFVRDDIERFVEKKQKQLSGLYEDGYDWADGYHTRAMYVVHCQ